MNDIKAQMNGSIANRIRRSHGRPKTEKTGAKPVAREQYRRFQDAQRTSLSQYWGLVGMGA